MTATGVQVVMDCADPAGMAEFWGPALGYVAQKPPDGFESWEAWLETQGIPREQWNSANAVVHPDGTGPRLYFQRVPETKVVKNRVHLDLNVSGGPGTPPEERRRRVDAEVERLVALGATRGTTHADRGEYFTNMLDREGNEFCVQ